MGEKEKYIYSEDKLKMIEHNVPSATIDLHKALRALNNAVYAINMSAEDVEAAGLGYIPSERKKPTCIGNIHPVPVREWMFNPVNVGNCHDCPLHDNDSGKGRCPCGAHSCIIGKLCDLAGTR